MTSKISDNNHFHEIVGSTDNTFASIQPREFKPWHKPRKQFVRRKQWVKLTKKLFDDRSDNTPLRYLSLPGIDLLDIRYMHQKICHNQGRDLRFLGFNNEAQNGNSADIQLNISLNEVRQLSNIDPTSDVVRDDFRMIANEKSLAWRQANLLGPFDVANIDLCKGLLSDAPSATNPETMYGALERLLSIQARNHNPWLMFITTRIGRQLFDPEAESKIIEIYRNHINGCKDFRCTCKKLMTSNPIGIDILADDGHDYFFLMVIALAKWLSSLIRAHVPSPKVELVSVLGYQIDPDSSCEDMVSFAIRSNPSSSRIDDPLNPTPAMQQIPQIDCTSALQIAKRVTKFKNIDSILIENFNLEQRLITETKDLLHLARYDESKYLAWLKQS